MAWRSGVGWSNALLMATQLALRTSFSYKIDNIKIKIRIDAPGHTLGVHPADRPVLPAYAGNQQKGGKQERNNTYVLKGFVVFRSQVLTKTTCVQVFFWNLLSAPMLASLKDLNCLQWSEFQLLETLWREGARFEFKENRDQSNNKVQKELKQKDSYRLCQFLLKEIFIDLEKKLHPLLG